jgi:hypothetical protein
VDDTCASNSGSAGANAEVRSRTLECQATL